MLDDSTNLVLLFVVCGGLVAALLINALRLRRQGGDAVAQSNIEQSNPQSPATKTLEPALWRRTIQIALLGTGMLLLLPISAALHVEELAGAMRMEAFVRTLVFLVPLALCVFYGRRSGRPDVK